MEVQKQTMQDKVEKKFMPLARWNWECLKATHKHISNDPYFKSLPQFNQTSALATVFIATNSLKDKLSARESAEKLTNISNATSERKVVNE